MALEPITLSYATDPHHVNHNYTFQAMRQVNIKAVARPCSATSPSASNDRFSLVNRPISQSDLPTDHAFRITLNVLPTCWIFCSRIANSNSNEVLFYRTGKGEKMTIDRSIAKLTLILTFVVSLTFASDLWPSCTGKTMISKWQV